MEWKLYIEIGNENFVMQYVRADIQSGLEILWFQTLWHKI